MIAEAANLFNQFQKFKIFLISCPERKPIPWLENIIESNLFKIERDEDVDIEQLQTIRNFLLNHMDEFANDTIIAIDDYIRAVKVS